MFATYSQHKLPVQFPGDPSTVWTCVELVMDLPFYLCTLDVEGTYQRFFHSQEEELVRLACATSPDPLVQVDLVVPPESKQDSWKVLQVDRIMKWRETRSGGPRVDLVLFTKGGDVFSGFPLRRTNSLDPCSLALVADFKIRSMTVK